MLLIPAIGGVYRYRMPKYQRKERRYYTALIHQLDGCYRAVIEYSVDGLMSIHREYTFTPAESDAEPLDGVERIQLEFK